jgi:2-succinyl-6-hydroxy-2,4-cyclohexadiene-1-carboxylate synthase
VFGQTGMMCQKMPTILLLHGFTNTGRSWDGVIAALPEGYRPLAPDIRGHGTASDLRPITLAAVMQDLEAAAPESFTLVGYSMGGRIALHLAFKLSRSVRRLVLIGASPGLKNAAARAERRTADAKLAEYAEHGSIAEFVDRWARTAVMADQPEAVRAVVDADRLRNDPVALAAALRGLGTGALPSLWPRLASLEIPVDLVVGERDDKFREIATQMSNELPHASVVIVPGAGHAVQAEAPEAVARVIADAAA